MVRKMGLGFLIVIAALAALFLLGPRPPADATITFDPASMADDLDAYLAASEAKVPAIREGLQKEIIWFDGKTGERTPWSIVYLHGFSASKEEVRPLPDLVARALGANIFYTRFTGHGTTGEDLARATFNDWANDVAEALEIGNRIGEQTLVISASTGGSLVTWAAADRKLAARMSALVMISPNYGVQAAGSSILTMPWAETLVPLVGGKTRTFETRNEGHAHAWTWSYPTVAVIPMAVAVDAANAVDPAKIDIPALFIYSPLDTVVRPDLTEQIAQKWGGGGDVLMVEEDEDPNHHVIAGRILSPGTTDSLADNIIDWIDHL